MISRKQRGFTLVELLVVIAIIGMLVGILLPAVQGARNAGRRTQNTNNLKNIGLAVLSYNDAQGSLPPLRRMNTGERNQPRSWAKYPTPDKSVSWAFELLPYLEQGNIYDSFKSDQPVWAVGTPDRPLNEVAMRQVIPLYANPGVGEATANCSFANGDSGGTCIHSAANRGFFDTQGRDPDAFRMSIQNSARTMGPFVHNELITTAHVKDGMSRTFAVGDKSMDPANPYDQAGLAGQSDAGIMRGPIGRVEYIEGRPRYSVQGSVFPTGNYSPDKFGGADGNVMAMAYLDGHVAWLEYTTVDPQVFSAQCTIDGGEIIVEDP